MNKCDVLVLGAGSLGLSFALKMHGFFKKSKTIGVVCSRREGFYKNIQKKGIILKQIIDNKKKSLHFEANKNFMVFSSSDVSDIQINKNAVILIACKTPQLNTMFNKFIPHFFNNQKNIIIVIIQNGINPEEMILKKANQFGLESIKHRLVGAVVLCTAHIEDRKNPKIFYKKGTIEIGSWNQDLLHEGLLTNIKTLLNPVADIQISLNADVYKLSRYKKAIINNANIISAIFGMPLCKIMKNKILNEILKQKVKDYLKVMHAMNIHVEFEEIWNYLQYIFLELFPEHYASMMRDIEKFIHQRRSIITEISVLDTYLTMQAHCFEFSIPTTSFLLALFTLFTNNYNRILKKNREQAVRFAKNFINRNAQIIEETPYFLDIKPENKIYDHDFPEIELISLNFLQLFSKFQYLFVD